MQVGAAVMRQLQREAGMLPLATTSGLQAFYQALVSPMKRVVVMSGELARSRALFAPAAGTAATPEPAHIGAAPEAPIRVCLPRRRCSVRRGLLAELTKLKAGADSTLASRWRVTASIL